MGRQIVGRIVEAPVSSERQCGRDTVQAAPSTPEVSLRCVKKLIFFAQFCMVSSPVKRHDGEAFGYGRSAGESGWIHAWIEPPWRAAFWSQPVDFAPFGPLVKRSGWDSARTLAISTEAI